MKNGKMKRYTELSDKYLNDAKVLLKDGDLAQASEKLWGAFATIVKAVAAKRNKNIKTHEAISAPAIKEPRHRFFVNVPPLLRSNLYHLVN